MSENRYAPAAPTALAKQEDNPRSAWAAMHEERQLEARDRNDRGSAMDAMQREWGPDYQTNVANITRYLDSLPEAERQRIESETEANGSLRLNNPDRLRELAKLAQPRIPTDPAAVDAELADIERRMRRDRSAYNRDAALQARYRALLRQKG